MPCQVCKAVGHTLTKCKSEQVDIVIGKTIGMITSRPFDLMYQIRELRRLNKVDLSIVCHSLDQHTGGPKDVLINRITGVLFTGHTSDLHTVTNEDINKINISYDEARNLAPNLSRETIHFNSVAHCVHAIEVFYMRRFGIVRNGMSLAVYYGRVNHMLEAQARGENMNEYFEQFDEPLHQVQPEVQPLQFAVTVDASLTVQECCICYDNKQMVKLGCNHEFCVDCIVGSTTGRQKSFITCAMCRAEITEVAVIDDANKTEMETRIGAC
jgi:hypothetical protein